MAEPDRKEVEAPAELVSAESMLEMIITKEDEIKSHISKAENEAQRKVEEAKLDAAVMKREAVTAVVGGDLREKEIAKAQVEGDRVSAEIGERAQKVREQGMENIEDAVKIVIDAVLPH
jgi:vacuolar-type H+-ATPase subunit H